MIEEKERNGITRAVLSGILASGNLDRQSLLKASELQGQIKNFQTSFNLFADSATKTMRENIVTELSNKKVQRIIDDVLLSGKTSNFITDASTWFNHSTAKINLLKELEDNIASSVIGYTEKVISNYQESNNINLYISIFVFILVLVGFIVLGSIIAKNIKKANQSISEVVELSEQGNFEKRINELMLGPDFRQLVKNLNKLLDVYQNSSEVFNGKINELASGYVPDKIEGDYKGKFLEIQNSINTLIDVLNNFLIDLLDIYDNHSRGFINEKIDIAKFDGVFSSITDNVNELVKDHINTNKKIINAITEYTEGNFAKDWEDLPGDREFINESVNNIKKNLLSIVDEVNNFNFAIQNGNTFYRIDLDHFKGDWKQIPSGINNISESFLNPINDTIDSLKRMAD